MADVTISGKLKDGYGGNLVDSVKVEMASGLTLEEWAATIKGSVVKVVTSTSAVTDPSEGTIYWVANEDKTGYDVYTYDSSTNTFTKGDTITVDLADYMLTSAAKAKSDALSQGDVYLDNEKLKAHIELDGLQGTIQYSELPDATSAESLSLDGKVIQYTGSSTSEYRQGHFYLCTLSEDEDEGSVVSWADVTTDIDNDDTTSTTTTFSASYITSLLSGVAKVSALTLAKYNALTDSAKNNGTVYYITDEGTIRYKKVVYGAKDTIVPNDTSVASTDTLTSISINGVIYDIPSSGGGGGTANVSANPEDDATDTLSKLMVDDVVYAVKGEKGDAGKDGTSISSIAFTTESTDGYVYDMTLSTGESAGTFTAPFGPKGVGVKSVTCASVSTDGGGNIVTVILTDGTESTFTIKNGTKGSQGDSCTANLYSDTAGTAYHDGDDHCYVGVQNGDGDVTYSGDLMSAVNNVLEAIDEIMDGNVD